MLLLFFASLLALPAQIVLSGNAPGNGISVQKEPPFFTAVVKAEKNGSPYVLTRDNLLILESNYSVVPTEVQPPENGFQKVKWKLGNYRISPAYLSYTFLAFDNTATGQAAGRQLDTLSPFIVFQDDRSTSIRALDFGNVQPGATTTIRVQIRPITGIKNPNDTESPVPVDSMVVEGEGFSAVWRGYDNFTDPPPTRVYSSFPYKIDVSFQAGDNSYQTGSITVYYNNGLHTKLLMKANTFVIPDVPAIRVLTPNGSEKLAPCQEIPVQWEGHISSMPTIAEYSIDGGRSWIRIGESNSNSLIWRVPGSYSDSVLIRVRQELSQSEIVRLEGPQFAVNALAFNASGDRLIAGYANATLVEWNISSASQVQTFQLSAPDPLGRTPVIGTGYTSTGDIAAAFRTFNGITTLALFRSGNSLPYVEQTLPADFNAKSMSVSPDGTSLFVVPDRGTRIFVYSAADASFVRSIDMPAPVTALSFSSAAGTIGVALLDNTVRILSLPDFTITRTISLPDLPIIHRLALSADNSFIAIATQVSKPTLSTGAESEIHVLQTATGTIIRTLRNIASSNSVGLSFSSTARFLAVGLEGTPQIGLWNLLTDSFNSSFDGHTGLLTDIRFSPVGTALVSSSTDKTDNLRARKFAFPESDVSDTFLRILQQSVAAQQPSLPPTYIGRQFDTVLTTSFCNNGEVPLYLTGVRFEKGVSFKLVSPFMPDTLTPGECMTFTLAFEPKDTGVIEDKLIYSTCTAEFSLPLQAVGNNRTIALLADNTDFGEICVGESIEREIAFIRNDDPIPLTVNFIDMETQPQSPFTILNPPADTVLQPGETLFLRVRFQPVNVGTDRRLFRVHHSGQTAVVAMLHINGRGLGAEIALSKNDLRFLPEQPTRSVSLSNKADIPVKVDSIEITPAGAFTVITPLPVVIPPGGSIDLEVQWNLAPTPDATLATYFTPCAIAQTATLGLYQGLSTLSMPVIEADPRGEASIPVRFSSAENKPYDGERVFETEFTVNAGLFLPQTVRSDYGEATIIRNDVVGDTRFIGIRVEGEFPLEGVAAVVTGPAGLGAVLTSPLTFIADQQPWGQAVQTTLNAGEFRLTNVCEDRTLVKPGAAIVVHTVYPNPAWHSTTVEFEAPVAGVCTVQLIDPLGQSVGGERQVQVTEGRNTVQVPLPDVSNGSYRLVVRQGTAVTSVALTVRNQ